jgi:Mg2+-importing ATPase
MRGLIRFTAIMGPLSSLFDLLTFGGLIYIFQASPTEFRTTWFLESMATQILVIFIIRTNGRPWKNLPQPALTASSLVALVVAMVVPFTPAGRWFGFEAPPLGMLSSIGLLVVLYLVCAELLKRAAVAPSAAVVVRRSTGAVTRPLDIEKETPADDTEPVERVRKREAETPPAFEE